MSLLILGLLLFFGTHSISIVNEPWRNRMAARLGEQAWQGLYAVIALAGIVLMSIGYGQTRGEPVALYAPPTGLRHFTLLLMLPVFPLLIATYLPGRIKQGVKHPMLLATLLWATAHLLANGNLADVLLFGAFFLWAGIDRWSMTRRLERPLPALPPGKFNDAIALGGGLLLYAAFLGGLHLWLFGVPPVT